MTRPLPAVLAGALAIAACQGDPGPQPRTTTELLRSAGVAPGPDVDVIVDGKGWGIDSLDRVDVQEVDSLDVLTDTAAIRYLYGKPYRAVVFIWTDATPFD
ncbi:MAG TPA: hypothetical protein VF615_00340 [Longimicrobiaceae bacterium]